MISKRLLLSLFCLAGVFALGAPASAQIDDPAKLAALRPAEGLWMEAGRPGTGFNLQRRGNLIAVTLFDFSNGRQIWRLGTAALAGDTLSLNMAQFSGGSCFGCEPHEAPTMEFSPYPVTFTFQSARRAWVDLPNGVRRPLVSAPFGADYLEFRLRDELDDRFGGLLLPNLKGRWSFRDIESQDDVVVDFAEPSLTTGYVAFREAGVRQTFRYYKILCSDLRDGRPAGCSLEQDFGAPGENPGIPSIGFAELGDVEENRIRFVAENGRVFYAYRMVVGP